VILPFNKNKNLSATLGSITYRAQFQDRWSRYDDVSEKWVDKITKDFSIFYVHKPVF